MPFSDPAADQTPAPRYSTATTCSTESNNRTASLASNDDAGATVAAEYCCAAAELLPEAANSPTRPPCCVPAEEAEGASDSKEGLPLPPEGAEAKPGPPSSLTRSST